MYQINILFELSEYSIFLSIKYLFLVTSNYYPVKISWRAKIWFLKLLLRKVTSLSNETYFNCDIQKRNQEIKINKLISSYSNYFFIYLLKSQESFWNVLNLVFCLTFSLEYFKTKCCVTFLPYKLLIPQNTLLKEKV